MAYQPTIIDRWLHVPQLGYQGVERRYIGRFGMSAKIIVIHIQEGSNLGSWQHFHVVSASSTVLIGKNGDIWRLVPESDAPWTNGDVMNPTPLGWEIINKWGADPNVYTLSIETEGFSGDAVPDAQMQAVVWQVQQWQQKYEIDGYYVVRHADINQVTRPRCPGDAYFNALKQNLQATVPPPTPVSYATPAKLYDKSGVLIDGTRNAVLSNGVTFYGHVATVHAATDGVQPHLYATRTSAFTRSALNEGDEFNVIGWVTGEKVGGDNRWWITKHYSRIDVNGTVEKPPSDASGNPDFPPGTRMNNGILYFPVESNGKPYRNLKVARRANLRESASLSAPVVGTVSPDQYVRARYWCMGEEVHEQRAWWVLDRKDGSDAILTGPRLWCAATYSQPKETYGQ